MQELNFLENMGVVFLGIITICNACVVLYLLRQQKWWYKNPLRRFIYGFRFERKNRYRERKDFMRFAYDMWSVGYIHDFHMRRWCVDSLEYDQYIEKRNKSKLSKNEIDKFKRRISR